MTSARPGPAFADPRLALALAVVCVSSSAILTRYTAAAPLAVAGWRLAGAAALLMLWPGAWRGLRGLQSRDVRGAAMAALFLAIHFGAWIASLRLLSVAASVLVVSMHPIFILAYRMATGDWPTLSEAVGALLAFAGVTVMFIAGRGSAGAATLGRTQVGFALALTGAAALAGYLLCGAAVRRRVRTSSYLLMVNSLAAVALFGFLAGAGGRVRPAFAREYGLYMALAIVPTLGGHGLFAYAVGRMRTIAVSVAFLMEPVAASLMAIPLFHEVPGRATLVGGLLTLLGLLLVVGSSEPEPVEGRGPSAE